MVITLNIIELAKLINAKCPLNCKNTKITTFITDTRKLKKNDVFIAINNGHQYLNEIEKCKAVIVENDFKSTKFIVLKVDDTKVALTKIASYMRSKYRGKIIAITGSNGKTTTKELLSYILSQKYTTYKTYKNTNNLLGVSSNLLNINNSQMAVLELGMNHPGEISELSKLVKPHIGIITNIGTAHIEFFGNKKKIYESKMEILDGMSEKKLFVNANDDFLKKSPSSIKVSLKNNLFEISNLKTFPEYLLFDLKMNKKYKIKFNIPSTIQINNIALAIYVSLYLKIKPKKIVRALNNFKPPSMRLELIKSNDKIVIDDSYNSNYESLMAGLDVLSNYNLDKICVIGAILELGIKESEIYKKIAANLNQDYQYIFVGNKIKAKKAIYFDTVYELINYYYDNKDKFRNKVIYVKGSHGVKLNEFVKHLVL